MPPKSKTPRPPRVLVATGAKPVFATKCKPKKLRIPKTPENSEYELQKTCAAWLRATLPSVTFTATVGGVHLANGVRGAAMLKSAGYLNGIPDICIYRAVGKMHGLFIELKLPGNKPTAVQLAVHACLRAENYKVCVIYTFEEFELAVKTYLFQDVTPLAEYPIVSVVVDGFAPHP